MSYPVLLDFFILFQNFLSNIVNFFPWGYLKDGVYENNPHTTEALKDNIRKREIRQIPQEMMNRVVDNFNVRVAAVLSYSSGVPGRTYH